MKILENGVVRDATPDEIIQRENEVLAEEARILAVVPVTKDQLLIELAVITAKIQALS